jgi:hypothetical protein
MAPVYTGGSAARKACEAKRQITETGCSSPHPARPVLPERIDSKSPLFGNNSRSICCSRLAGIPLPPLARPFKTKEKVMIRVTLPILAAAGTALLAASPALAEPQPGRLSGTLYGGGDFPVGGKLHDGASAPVADLGALNPALAGTPATLDIESRSHGTVYDTAWSLGGEFAYGVSENGEVLGGLRYTRANGNRLQVGTAAAGAPVNATLPVFGRFGDYKAWGLDAGYRHYLGSPGGLRPYLAGHLGATRTKAIGATFEIPDAAITIANAPFYKSGWSFSTGADLGISVPVSSGFSLQAETGIRYVDGLKDDDTALSGLGLGAINDAGKRWSIPLTLRAKVNF